MRPMKKDNELFMSMKVFKGIDSRVIGGWKKINRNKQCVRDDVHTRWLQVDITINRIVGVHSTMKLVLIGLTMCTLSSFKIVELYIELLAYGLTMCTPSGLRLISYKQKCRNTFNNKMSSNRFDHVRRKDHVHTQQLQGDKL